MDAVNGDLASADSKALNNKLDDDDEEGVLRVTCSTIFKYGIL